MLTEAASMSKADFMAAMQAIYDSGDERLVKKAVDLGSDIMVEDIINDLFAQKLPKAESGANEKLALEIQKLRIPGDQKVELANGMLDGTAFDILGLMKRARKKPTPVASCINSKFKPMVSKEFFEWFNEWKAMPDAGARGRASNEMFIIAVGKNGRTPPKGDCEVDGVFIESKSAAGGFGGEFSISGKQGSMFPVAEDFQRKLFSKLDSLSVDTKQLPADLPFGSGGSDKKKSMPQFLAAINKSIEALMEGGMSVSEINKWWVDTTNAVFNNPGLSEKCVEGKGEINVQNFLALWNACAFQEYKLEEGFDLMVMFDRKAGQCITFYEGKDILALKSNLRTITFSMKKGFGQNNSIGGLEFKF